ncbi:MAG: hypothetical protein ACRELE_00820 [Gemmatimonadales bacterium]
MRRFVGPGLGLLLAGVVAPSAAAQRSPDAPAFALEEPRPDPVLPAALVPFVIASDVCHRGHTPRVALRVYNVFVQPVASLRLRDRRPAVVLDSVPLGCGRYVAQWDGTIAGGTRAASPGIYYLRLSVDERSTAKKIIITPP